MPTATQVRRDAIARLIALAGDQPYDVDLVAARSDSLELLRRRALVRGHRAEVTALWPVAVGHPSALYDATQEAARA